MAAFTWNRIVDGFHCSNGEDFESRYGAGYEQQIYEQETPELFMIQSSILFARISVFLLNKSNNCVGTCSMKF